ncbi:hypothetical protein G7B40_009780 [Aetokthonos hydrillicola Thurmond2011]|jgi:hypothetical protein|uniref:Uncharacterized protein n=1 Tax=Aetokthonos hydrillicola Thurmond2011 TaxID=2712845 RepID=A0AAP5I755_9CYAN|nr:hypothetical protein [Aetokthonos hydrillicola]MBO3464537.1 hypothetical protein [Aetokthonos hydrillicola CCALA 1050]MDR9894852.1 hypothetical protein [Aetokthonos hydrillicola Thurmond2011]
MPYIKRYIDKLSNSSNGKFILFSKQDRIHLELTYKLITDIQNKDFDINLKTALNVLVTYQEWYHWLFTMFGFTEPAREASLNGRVHAA